MSTPTPHINIIPREWFEETVRGLSSFTAPAPDVRCELEQMNEGIYRVFLIDGDGKRTSASRLIVEFGQEQGYDNLANPRVTLHLEKKLFDGFTVNRVEAIHPRGSERATLRRPQRGDLELAREIVNELDILCRTAEQIARKIEGYAATPAA